MCVLRSNCKHFLILVSLLMECSVLAWLGTYCILQISTCGQWTSFEGELKGKNRRVCVGGVCGEACVSKMKTLVFSSYLKGKSQFSLFPVYFFHYSQRTTSDTSGYQMHVGFSHNNEYVSNTSWVAYSLTQLSYHLPRDSVSSHRFGAQSHKTALPSSPHTHRHTHITPHSSWKSSESPGAFWASDQLAVDWKFQWPSPLDSVNLL